MLRNAFDGTEAAMEMHVLEISAAVYPPVEGIFRAHFRVPRMRASVCSVVEIATGVSTRLFFEKPSHSAP